MMTISNVETFPTPSIEQLRAAILAVQGILLPANASRNEALAACEKRLDCFKHFLKAWLEWVDEGAPSHDFFDRSYGLCFNFYYFALRNGAGDYAYEMLAEIFGSGQIAPFKQYAPDLARMKHANPARIAWAQNVLEVLKSSEVAHDSGV